VLQKDGSDANHGVCAEFLLDYGADMYQQNQKHRSAFYACQETHIPFWRELFLERIPPWTPETHQKFYPALFKERIKLFLLCIYRNFSHCGPLLRQPLCNVVIPLIALDMKEQGRKGLLVQTEKKKTFFQALKTMVK
jgi:hypothetical protein